MPDFIEIPCIDSFKKKRARFLFRVRNEKARIEDEQLAATQSHGVLSQKRYVEITGNRVVEALTGTENFTHADQNDFVISLRTFEGGIEIAKEAGCISPAYTVLSPSREVYPPYFKHFFKSSVFISHLQTTITGIREGKTVKFENVANIILPIPDKSTQRKIADFLDRETTRIDLLIAKKERMVSLLREYKDTTISVAVMGNALLGSGKMTAIAKTQIVDCMNALTFLEQFASNYSWDSAPAKRRFRNIKQINKGMQEDHRLALTLGGVIDRSLDDVEGLQASDYETYQIFEKDDLVFKLIDLENIRTSRVGHVPRRGIMSPAYIRLSSISDKVVPRYYYWLFYAVYLNNIFNGMGGGVRQNLTPADLLEFPIPLTPEGVQQEIADFLDKETARIDSLIKKQESAINLLREYKAALITAAVTGQIDVESASKSGTNEHHLDRLQKESEA